VRAIAHLSDLHFGGVEPAVLEALRRRLNALAPDLVVVSGDLTQRARAREFREARAFLDSLPAPQVVVPGNHDVPLYNVLARFLSPLGRYRRIVSEEVEPGFVDDEIAVLGVNTARSFVLKGGRVSAAQIERVRRELSRPGGERTKILVAHHSCKALEDCGVDVVVSGHRHATRVSCRRLPKNSYLMIEAGTATSHRTREEPNAFNLLRIRPGRVAIEHYALRGGNFLRAGVASFSRQALGWRRDGPA
jgi:3',5'-cyclic AMP phosphodiesterase CpdA